MPGKPIQDFYEDEVAICYGCGRHNTHGLNIRTYWDGEEGVCHFKPRSYHTAFPGFVYGGLIASLIDCHSVGTATAASYQAEGREPGTEPQIRFVTGTLNVRYLQPTPINVELILRARIKALYEKKIVVSCSLYANEKECAQGEVIAIRAPRNLNLDNK
jgi:acyl-coenzyme A thioesterase PaaI-like protein